MKQNWHSNFLHTNCVHIKALWEQNCDEFLEQTMHGIQLAEMPMQTDVNQN